MPQALAWEWVLELERSVPAAALEEQAWGFGSEPLLGLEPELASVRPEPEPVSPEPESRSLLPQSRVPLLVLQAELELVVQLLAATSPEQRLEHLRSAAASSFRVELMGEGPEH
jgi:hypothetical protein